MKKIFGVIIAVCFITGVFIMDSHNEAAMGKEKKTRELLDETGREVVVPEQPQRVIFLSATHLDLFVAAGGKDKVAGKPTSQTLSQEVAAATDGVTEIGPSMAINSEVMMSLNPDLVIGINMQPHTALIPMFEQAGIPVYIHNINTYEQVLQHLQLYGELAATPAVAESKIAEAKAQYNEAIAKSAGKKAPASLILWGTPESFSMGTKKSFVGDLIERLGGNNILDNSQQAETASTFLPLSMEYVTKADPEIIFLITHGSPEGLKEKFSREMNENPIWQNMSAVKNNRIYTLPYQIFAVNPGSRIGQSMNVLAVYMYGET